MMLINETPPSVRRIETDRADAYAFEITGHVSASDLENLYGLLDGAYELHERIDLIVVIHDYEGFDWRAAWKHQTLLGKSRALKRVRRYAVVGGPGWIRPMVSLLRPFLPVKMRHFETDKAEAAWAWIEASPLPSPA